MLVGYGECSDGYGTRDEADVIDDVLGARNGQAWWENLMKCSLRRICGVRSYHRGSDSLGIDAMNTFVIQK